MGVNSVLVGSVFVSFFTAVVALHCYHCGMYNDGVGSITPCLNETHMKLLECPERDTNFCIKDLLKMWMHYASQSWPEAVDIKSAVKRLRCELYCLDEDSLHAQNYDMNYCFCEEKVRQLEEDCKMYRRGVSLCDDYLSGTLNLDNFCEKMMEIELKRFLIFNLLDYLPYATVVKYKLTSQENSVEVEDY